MMKRQRVAAQSRARLDRRFAAMPPPAQLAPPVRGWIRAVREALGMTAVQLGKRLNVSQPSVTALEQSEQRGSIELATLRRVAAALDCELVYALVPRQKLAATVRARARAVARRRLDAVTHTMRLENQEVAPQELEARLDELAEDVDPRDLWNDA